MAKAASRRLPVSDHALQQAVGWTSLLMPVAVRLLAFAFDQVWTTNSISAYYYTDLRDVFVGALVIGGVVLVFFKTGRELDQWLAAIAGIAAIGIAFFPMDIAPGTITSPETGDRAAETKMVDALKHGTHGPIGYHFYFVAVFFLLTFYLVTFSFRVNTPAIPSAQKLRRNRVYAVCGLLMAFAFVWIGILWHVGKERSIFWPETLAVMSFATAWLVKGQLVLKDKRPDSQNGPGLGAGSVPS